jgi:UDP-2,3-diacylglucosamine hydrolase
MATLFISDLHLEDSRPEITEVLVRFLRGTARQAEALYILGDLFEFWIGDDYQSDTSGKVALELRSLSDSGVPVYFQHGNRDFLLGKKYAREAGMKLMTDEVLVTLYGRPTLLLHGDSLCTDDVEYQKFRKKVRNPIFRTIFLLQSIQKRLSLAANARDASKQHTGKADMSIMDVNRQAVIATFKKHQSVHMIHGHTHRPAVHAHPLGNGETAERIVLADWYKSGSYLRVDSSGAESILLDA